jgi:hypothetical protein
VKHNPSATKIVLAAALCLAGAAPALASDRWEEAGRGAVAILPVPKPAAGITGGSLYCAEQRWAFLFRTAPETGLPMGSAEKAKLGVGSDNLELDAEVSPGAVKVAVPAEILLQLKEATKLVVEIGTAEDAPKATFNLRSSKLVIEAIAPRCSQIDMSAFEAVSLSEADAAVPAATGLLADEIKLFREFTLKQPVIATTTVDIAADRRLMFASLCGSNNYFGDSGCSLTGYAADGADSIWRVVYETEGVHVYLDPKHANGGWPNIVTLPVVGGTEPTHWVWSGTGYELLDQITAEEDKVQEQGDAGQ